jgi:hypothetical protein
VKPNKSGLTHADEREGDEFIAVHRLVNRKAKMPAARAVLRDLDRFRGDSLLFSQIGNSGDTFLV